MQSCCIIGCESIKNTSITKPVFFKFPLHDKILLEEWLKRIDRANWIPSPNDQICGSHFIMDDIEPGCDQRYPSLKSGAIPALFPNKPIVLQLKTDETGTLTAAQLKLLALKPNERIVNIEPGKIIELNKPLSLTATNGKNAVNTKFIIKLTPVTQEQLQKISHENTDAINISNQPTVIDLTRDTSKNQTKCTMRKINILRKNVNVQKTKEKEKNLNVERNQLIQKKPTLKMYIDRRYNTSVSTNTITNSKRVINQNEDLLNNNTYQYKHKKLKTDRDIRPQNEQDSTKENLKADAQKKELHAMQYDGQEEFEKLIEEVRALKAKPINPKKKLKKRLALPRKRKHNDKEETSCVSDLSKFSLVEDGEIIGEFKDDPSLKETDDFIDAMLNSNTKPVFNEYLEPILLE